MVGRTNVVKKAALSGRKRKPKKTATGSHQARDRVLNDEDFEVVHSRDGRLTSRGVPVETQRSPQKGRIGWSAIESWKSQGSRDLGFDLGSSSDFADISVELGPHPRKKRKRSKKSVGFAIVYSQCICTVLTPNQRRINLVWLEVHRSDYLDQLIRHDGRQEASSYPDCIDCVRAAVVPPNEAVIRCLDCMGIDMCCGSCCVRRHGREPFHRVEVCASRLMCCFQLNFSIIFSGGTVNSSKGRVSQNWV